LTLPDAVDGRRFGFGDGLSAYVAGEGAPLLLVHSVNAAASVAEVRPLFEHFAARRTVYALDLPGFGHSRRGALDYTPRLMTDALQTIGAEIRRRHGAAPIDALAVSLGCEFLARAAGEQPQHWGRLALVSPTGFNGRTPRRGPPGATRQLPGLLPVLSVPLWSQALFGALTRPGVVRFFLEKTWGGKTIDEAAWDYAVRTAREPGARFAPLAFLSGKLFSADVQALYEALVQPVWMSHGTRGDFTDYRAKAIVEGRPNWRFKVYPTGALPYFERPTEFCADFEAFLDAAPS
jgi:pimeloyl-ACP methyl ester carboxylesterase